MKLEISGLQRWEMGNVLDWTGIGRGVGRCDKINSCPGCGCGVGKRASESAYVTIQPEEAARRVGV